MYERGMGGMQVEGMGPQKYDDVSKTFLKRKALQLF